MQPGILYGSRRNKKIIFAHKKLNSPVYMRTTEFRYGYIATVHVYKGLRQSKAKDFPRCRSLFIGFLIILCVFVYQQTFT